MSGQDLTNVRALFAANGKWSLDEQGVLTVEEVKAKTVTASEKICIQDVCVNRDQLNALLINAGASQGSAPAAVAPTSTDVPPPSDPTPVTTPADTTSTPTDVVAPTVSTDTAPATEPVVAPTEPVVPVVDSSVLTP